MTDRLDHINNPFMGSDLKNFLFDRVLSEATFVNQNMSAKIHVDKQYSLFEVEYSMNEHGYRSEEFNKENEVLVLGCSQSYGFGMPNEFTWPEIFCNEINKKYSRLATCGDSIGSQVYKAFKYFKEIGNPKIVVAAFPLFRLEYPIVPGKFASHHGKNKKLSSPSIAYFNDPYMLKFSKAPHDPVHIMPREFVIYYNFMFITMLEQYCDSNDIRFIWTIHDETMVSDYIETSLQDVFKNYFKVSDIISDIGYLNTNNMSNKLMHEKCSSKFKNHKLYDWAADYNEKSTLGHWGIHVHEHVAERFLNRYKEAQND